VSGREEIKKCVKERKKKKLIEEKNKGKIKKI
jgi:hypothetical protein